MGVKPYANIWKWVRGKRVLDPKRVLGPFKISSTLFPLFLEPFKLSSTLFPPLQEPFRLSSTLFPPSQKCSELSSTLFPPHGILNFINLYFFIYEWKMFATFTHLHLQNKWPKDWFLTLDSKYFFCLYWEPLSSSRRFCLRPPLELSLTL